MSSDSINIIKTHFMCNDIILDDSEAYFIYLTIKYYKIYNCNLFNDFDNLFNVILFSNQRSLAISTEHRNTLLNAFIDNMSKKEIIDLDLLHDDVIMYTPRAGKIVEDCIVIMEL